MRFLYHLVGLIGLAGTGIGAPTEPHSVNVREIDAKGIDVHNIDSNGNGISVNGVPVPIPVANIYVCAEQASTGCKLIDAYNSCVPFGSNFAYKSNYIRQAKGTWCIYYTKTGCMDGDVYFRYTSFPKLEAEFTGWGVKNLAGVFCAGTGQTLDIPVGEAHAVASRDTAVLQVSAAEIDKAGLGSVDAHGKVPGDTTICHGFDFTYCNDNRINAVKQCANCDSVDIGPASLIQHAGAYCKWYSDFGCNDKTLVGAIDSIDGAVTVADLEEYTNKFFSVKCEDHAW